MKPSTEVLPMLNAVFDVYFTDEPSQNLQALSKLTIEPFRIDEEYGLQVYGSTAITFVPGLICFMTLAIELVRPPPPAGTKI